jgi:Heterokaryon incompatibility protein (HET)
MDFEYRQLSPHEIRLLKPHARLSDPLSFEIFHESINSKARYVALSYTLGVPGNAHTVLLNGKRLPIRQNLHDALQQIRRSKLVE